jgi:hypothetical protein
MPGEHRWRVIPPSVPAFCGMQNLAKSQGFAKDRSRRGIWITRLCNRVQTIITLQNDMGVNLIRIPAFISILKLI